MPLNNFLGEHQGLWLVIRSIKSQISNGGSYKLKKFDIVKLGRVRFKVKDFNFKHEELDTFNLTSANAGNE